MSNALTTAARVKDRLKITVSTFDTLFSNLIVSVTARMETMCGRQFTLATYTHELHDGSDLYGSFRSQLITKNAPIGSVSAVSYKTGTNASPTWVEFTEEDYDLDADTGILHFRGPLPRGKRNIRITYSAGWDGYAVGLTSYWNFNVTPTGLVNGSNLTFTLPEDADELIVYADGLRESAANLTFTAGTDEFTLAAGRAPYTTIVVDYKETLAAASGDPVIPAELVDVCERAVVHLFKKRDSEGKSTESFQESSITWNKAVFDEEMLTTIKNYRRGYHL